MLEFDLFELTKATVTLLVGFTAVLASLGVILCSSPIYCALYLIGHMICLALLFLLYNAEFIAAVQIIVYAGAVMILFLFIIALLGGKKEVQEPSLERTLAVLFVATMLGELFLSATVGSTKPIEGGFDLETVAEVGAAKSFDYVVRSTAKSFKLTKSQAELVLSMSSGPLSRSSNMLGV